MEVSVRTHLNLFRIWKGKESLEVFTLQQYEHGFIGGGIVRGNDFNIRYRIHTDLNWQVQKVLVEDIDRPGLNLEINRAENNSWHNEFGNRLSALDGCEEVDLSITPFTNSIALQKIAGWRETTTFKVIYIRVPEFDLSVVEQQYTPIDLCRYKYENLTGKFSAELLVDEFGLVIDYADLYKVLAGEK